jgi:hypothetical protein
MKLPGIAPAQSYAGRDFFRCATRYRLRRNCVTTSGISTLAFATLFASNCAGFRNITEHWLQALNGVSYRAPVLRSTLTW